MTYDPHLSYFQYKLILTKSINSAQFVNGILALYFLINLKILYSVSLYNWTINTIICFPELEINSLISMKSIFFIRNGDNTSLLGNIINKNHINNNDNTKEITSKKIILYY